MEYPECTAVKRNNVAISQLSWKFTIRCYSKANVGNCEFKVRVTVNLSKLSKAKLFLAAAFAALVGVGLFVRPVLAASTITVYKTPT